MQSDKGQLEPRLEIQKLNELPPLSPVVPQLMAALEDRDIGLGELARIIDKDPALLARIIGLANSAYFGCPERISSAEDAIIKVLGLNTTKSIALGIILSGPFNAARCPSFMPDRYWLVAVFCASLCQRLAPLIRAEDGPSPSDAYLGGMIYGLGLLALVHLYPERMDAVFQESEIGNSQRLVDLEQRELGVDHLQVGGWLGRKWHLPDPVVDVIEHRLENDYQGRNRALVQLVAIVAHYAKKVVYKLEGEEGDSEIEALKALGIDGSRARTIIEQQRERLSEMEELAGIMAD